jgi:hypothetical protein
VINALIIVVVLTNCGAQAAYDIAPFEMTLALALPWLLTEVVLRRRTLYAVTNRRAITLRGIPGDFHLSEIGLDLVTDIDARDNRIFDSEPDKISLGVIEPGEFVMQDLAQRLPHVAAIYEYSPNANRIKLGRGQVLPQATTASQSTSDPATKTAAPETAPWRNQSEMA